MENKFGAYALDEQIIKSLSVLHYFEPTPIQEQVIPTILNGQNCIIQSQTGSGKTAAFAIPLCEKIDWDENKVQALVITPTRELALQVRDEIFNIGRFKKIKAEAIFGKSSFESQRKQLKQKTHVVVGTPGRLLDHIEQATLDVSNVQYLIIDEADIMFEMGFVDQLEDILSHLPKSRITVLLSATMPPRISQLCMSNIDSPQVVKIEDEDTTALIKQSYIVVDDKDKGDVLEDIFMHYNPESCLIFCNTKQEVDWVYDNMLKPDRLGERLHGGMLQEQRIDVINAFKQHRFRYLVASDVAARGLDIDQVELVINFDAPWLVTTYVHRIGRTGRYHHKGSAITLVEPSQEKIMREIKEETGFEITKLGLDDIVVTKSMENDYFKKITAKRAVNRGHKQGFDETITKLHINAGKKIKMRPTDIVGTLCTLDNIDFSDIGIITITDSASFVEILNGKGAKVLADLQDCTIKGKIRKVSKAK